MTTMTAATLLERLKDVPEIRADLYALLDAEFNPAYPRRKPTNTERDLEIAKRVWAGESRREIAAEYGLGLPRIHQIMAANPNPAPTTKVNRNAERDAQIVAKARAKTPRAVIAKEFGLSLIRVHQIVGAEPKAQAKTWDERASDARTKYAMGQKLTPNETTMVLITSYTDVCEDIIADMREGKMHDYLEPKYRDAIDELPTNMDNYLDMWKKLCPREPYSRALMYQNEG